MGQAQSQAGSSGYPASHSTNTMGKRITAPASTTASQQTPTTTTTPPTLTPATVRTQLKHITASLTPSLVDAIKRRDESAMEQFEALHSQLNALYSNPSLPDEYEVRVHELWSRAETLRTAVNVVEGLKERGKVDVSEMEGEDERDKKREQARTRLEDVEREDKEQWKKAIELQKLAVRRAAEQKATRSKQSKLQGKVSKLRKNGTTDKPQQKKRKVVFEEDAEENESDSEQHLEVEGHSNGVAMDGLVQAVVAMEENDDEEETETLPPRAKKSKSMPDTSRVTRANGQQQTAKHTVTQRAKQVTPHQPPTLHTPAPTTTTSMPKTYTRSTATATTAAKSTPSMQTTPSTRSSPRKQSLPILRSPPATVDKFVTPAATAAKGTPNKHTTDRASQHSEQQNGHTTKPAAATSRLNMSRLTAGMTPERKKAQQWQQQQQQVVEVKEAAGPGVGRTGKRRRNAMVVREEQQDVYDTFDV